MDTSPPPAADLLLTPWQRYRQRRDAEPPRPMPDPHRDWTWKYQK